MVDRKKQAQLTSAIDLFGKSYATVRRNLNAYALVYAVPAALTIAGQIQIVADNEGNGWGLGQIFNSSLWGPNVSVDTSVQVASTLFAVALLVAAIIAYFMATILNVRAAEGKRPAFSQIWRELNDGWLWLKLTALSIVTALILFVGFLALIIPGVILLWRLYLAPYILVDKKTAVMESLAISWNMTRGYAWAIYSIILFSILLAVPNLIPFAGTIIAFLLSVAYAVAPALRYHEVKS